MPKRVKKIRGTFFFFAFFAKNFPKKFLSKIFRRITVFYAEGLKIASGKLLGIKFIIHKD